MAIREGRWDCNKCDTKGILGRYKDCPNCGGQRPANVHFYLPGDEPAVTDSVRLAEAKIGPDWTCESCGQDNPADRKTCRKCGSPKDSAKSRKVTDYGLENTPRSGNDEGSQYSLQPSSPLSTLISNYQETSVSIFDKIKIPAALITAILIIGALAFLIFGTHPVPVTVTGHSWQRTVSIEQYKTVRESDWSIPAGGREISESQEISGYNHVPTGSHQEPYQESHQEQTGTRTYTCGSRDLGNG